MATEAKTRTLPESRSAGGPVRPHIPSSETNQSSENDIFNDSTWKLVRRKLITSNQSLSLNGEAPLANGNGLDTPDSIAQNGDRQEDTKTVSSFNGKDSGMEVKPKVKIVKPRSTIVENDGTEYLKDPGLQEYLDRNPKNTTEGFIREKKREQWLANHSGGREQEITKPYTHRAIMWMRRTTKRNSIEEKVQSAHKPETIESVEKTPSSLDGHAEALAMTAIDSGLRLGSPEYERGFMYGIDYMVQGQKAIRAALNTNSPSRPNIIQRLRNRNTPEISQDSTRWQRLLKKRATRRAALLTGLSTAVGAGYYLPRLIERVPNAAQAEEFLLGSEPAKPTAMRLTSNQIPSETRADTKVTEPETVRSYTEILPGEVDRHGFSTYFSSYSLQGESSLAGVNDVMRVGHMQKDYSGVEMFVPLAEFRMGLHNDGQGTNRVNTKIGSIPDGIVFDWYPMGDEKDVTLAFVTSKLGDNTSQPDPDTTQYSLFTPDYEREPHFPLGKTIEVYTEKEGGHNLPYTWETFRRVKDKFPFVPINALFVRNQEWPGKRGNYYDVIGSGQALALSRNLEGLPDLDREKTLFMALSAAFFRQASSGEFSDRPQVFTRAQVFEGAFQDIRKYIIYSEMSGQATSYYNVFAQLDTMVNLPHLPYLPMVAYENPEDMFAKTATANHGHGDEIIAFMTYASSMDDQAMRSLCGSSYRTVAEAVNKDFEILNKLFPKIRLQLEQWGSPLTVPPSHYIIDVPGIDNT